MASRWNSRTHRQDREALGKVRRARRTRRVSPEILPLEERTLLTTGPSLSDVLNAYNTAVGKIAGESSAISGILGGSSGFGATPKLFDGNLADLLGLGDGLETPFQTTLSASNLSNLGSGFKVVKAFDGTTDSSGDLLAISWTQTLSQESVSTSIGAATGFSYLDNALTGAANINGSLSGSVQDVAMQVTMGVDLQGSTPTPTFFLDANPANSYLKVDKLNASGTIKGGNLQIGDLANVTLNQATATVGLNAGLTFQPSASETDGKLRVGDLGSASAYKGLVNGTVDLNASFTTQVDPLPSLDWSAKFHGAITNNAWAGSTTSLSGPSWESLLSGVVSDVLGLTGDFPLLGDLQSDLDQPLPLIDESVAQILGLDSSLPNIPGTGSLGGVSLGSLSPDALLADLSKLGFTINGGHTGEADLEAMVSNLINGKYVNLISWQPAGSSNGTGTINLLNWSKDIPIYSLGIADIASLDIDASLSASASLSYTVGMGFDTRGFWLQQGTGVGLNAKLSAGLTGSVEILGFPLASASGTISLSGPPGASGQPGQPAISLALAADPYTAAAHASDSNIPLNHVYLADLAKFGSDPIGDFLDGLQEKIALNLTGDVKGSINLVVGSISKDYSFSFPIVNYTHQPSWPSSLGGPNSSGSATTAPNPAGGRILTFNGTPGADLVQLSGSNGTVTINWIGQAKPQTFTNITRVVFNGDGGADQLTTAAGFNIPIFASTAGDKSPVYFQGGTANDTLIGGTAHDTLVGGDGNDTIIAGSGGDLIVGGAGNDSITGGAGADTLVGGDGNDTIIAGSGAGVSIDGGAGDDSINASAAGSNATIHGGGGNDSIVGPKVSGASIYGDAGNDTISGGAGNDTIDGGAGNDLIHGGAGDDWIEGGVGNDTLYGDAGNDTISGGDGNDVLFGGTGNGLDAGNNVLTGDGGNDTLHGDGTGHNRLYGDSSDNTDVPGSVGNDTLFAGSGGDYLDGGAGQDVLDGGAGADSLVVHFLASGGVQPDTLVGGPGNDTLVIEGTSQNDAIILSAVAGTSQTYSAALSDPTTKAARGSVRFTLPADVENIAIDGGAGNDLIQVDPSIRKNLILDGGAGNDTLFGGSGNDVLIGGPGNDVLDGKAGDDLLYGDDRPTDDLLVQGPGGTTNPKPVPGQDTLFGGDGNDQLFASNGGDVLVGGDGVLQNGQFVLVASAGRDILVGGTGNDLLIAGPGSLGDQMDGGAGNDTLVGDNGPNAMDGGDGSDLLLGGNLGNLLFGDVGNGSDIGNDTLVGGVGIDYLQGAGGNDVLFADASTALAAGFWTQAQATAGAHHVQLNPPTNPLAGDPFQLFKRLQAQDEAVSNQIDSLEQLKQTTGLTPDQQSQLTDLLNVNALLLQERQEVDHLLGASVLVDSLFGGAGNDTLYGSAGADWLSGDAGNDTLDYSGGNDTLAGGNGVNTVMFQGTAGNDTINLQHAVTGGRDVVNVTIDGKVVPWVVQPDIQAIGVQGLAGSDAISVNFGSWGGMNVYLDGGDGNDTINVSGLQGSATVLGGAGSDVLIASPKASRQTYDGGTGTNRLILRDSTPNSQVVLSQGKLAIDGPVFSTPTSNIQVFEVDGGPGNDTFATDGSIPSVILVGGTGTNALTIRGDDKGDILHLSQSGSTVTVSGSMSVTATRMTWVTVVGGAGDDTLDATKMTMGVTLDGGAGYNMLYGGAGGDTLVLEPGSVTTLADGGGGTNQVVYRAAAADQVVVMATNLEVNGQLMSELGLNHIASYDVQTGGAAVSVFRGNGQPTLRFGHYTGYIIV